MERDDPMRHGCRIPVSADHAPRGAELVSLRDKPGEPEVTHWHPLDDGYRGRKPLESEPEMLKI